MSTSEYFSNVDQSKDQLLAQNSIEEDLVEEADITESIGSQAGAQFNNCSYSAPKKLSNLASETKHKEETKIVFYDFDTRRGEKHCVTAVGSVIAFTLASGFYGVIVGMLSSYKELSQLKITPVIIALVTLAEFVGLVLTVFSVIYNCLKYRKVKAQHKAQRERSNRQYGTLKNES